MEITGKIIAVLPERSGVSARSGSEWRCASYVLETMEQYPRKMVFEVFGTDRIQQFNIQAGETMMVSFDIDAREYQGRWFNSIRAWKVDRNLQQPAAAPVDAASIPPFAPAPAAAPFDTNATAATAAPAPQPPFGAAPAPQFNEQGPTEDLPF